MSDSLWPHELQHARLPCPSPSLGACSNSCLLSQWCHSPISSSVAHFLLLPSVLSASGSFPVSKLFASGGQSIGASASAPVLPMYIQDWLAWSPCCPFPWIEHTYVNWPPAQESTQHEHSRCLPDAPSPALTGRFFTTEPPGKSSSYNHSLLAVSIWLLTFSHHSWVLPGVELHTNKIIPCVSCVWHLSLTCLWDSTKLLHIGVAYFFSFIPVILLWMTIPVYMGLPFWQSGKELPANARDARVSGSSLRLGRPPGGGNGNPLQYSCLENSTDRGTWQATVHEVT